MNDATSPLAGLADEVIPLHAGPDHSVAATKTYLASAAAIVHLVAAWCQDAALEERLARLPGLMETAWSLDWTPAVAALRSVRDLFVIGRGLGFGAAQEAALKFKETCALHAEAFSAAEVQHGPMALVKDSFPVLVFSQDCAGIPRQPRHGRRRPERPRCLDRWKAGIIAVSLSRRRGGRSGATLHDREEGITPSELMHR